MTLEERTDIPRTYRVFYNVDVRDLANPSCDCAAGVRGNPCHHLLFVLRHLREKE